MNIILKGTQRTVVCLKKTTFSIMAVTAISSMLVMGCTSSNIDADKQEKSQKPNIILLVTDDQGYGDVGRNHNPIIETPNIDKLAEQSARFDNFHVDPTCSPTRSALLTGKHSLKAGVWHTVLGRYMLGPEHDNLAKILKRNNYQTAIFGKWHLGDNYPYRPQDQGFDQAFIHGGGGVGQTPDYWGNTQFDDTYFRNGKPEKTEGYATTVWFNEAIKFIDQPRNQPFFSYIALNAPHGPYRAPEKFIKPYLKKGLNRTMASYYGMISHLDSQLARLRQHLADTNQLDNTIFIFMSDNGSAYHQTNDKLELSKQHISIKKNFPEWIPNDGMRGYKVSVYEGGHRVPFYISYPNAKLAHKDYSNIAAHFDVLPTLLDLAGIDYQPKDIDGVSLAKLLRTGKDDSLADRSIVITNQRVYHPSDKRPTAVATKKWRLITHNDKNELYDMDSDPSEQHNVIKQHPEVAKKLLARKAKWWHESQAVGFKDRYITVGNIAENPVRLNAMDFMEIPDEKYVPWFIGHQAPADEYDHLHWITREEDYIPLPWYIDVETEATYQIKAYFHDAPAATPVLKKFCVVETNGEQHVGRVYGRASHCVVNIKLNTGKQKIKAWFTDDPNSAEQKVAFYLYLKNPNLTNAH